MTHKVSDFEKEIDEMLKMADPYLTVDTVFGDGSVPMEVYGLLAKAMKLKKMMFTCATEAEEQIAIYRGKINEMERTQKTINEKMDRILKMLEKANEQKKENKE